MQSTGLRIRGLAKSYGDHQVLRGVALTAQPGEIVGLLGPNGAGKTTLTSIAAGLRSADAGEVEICGVDALADPAGARAHLGLAPQELGIYPQLSVRTNLEYFARLAGMGRRGLRDRVAEVAAALGLTDLLARRAGQLSGGQRRRLHTAMALVHRPRVLFLDEPTVGADVETRHQVLAVVRELAAGGVAVVYCTHYLPEIEALDARVSVLNAGLIVAEGTVRDLIDTHTEASVELVFDGEPPADLPGRRVAGAVPGTTLVVVPTTDPSGTLSGLLAGLGPAAGWLRSVEIRRPSLESAYLALVGEHGTGGDAAVRDAAA
ncbi:MAG: ABC transporter ATP-binding protein [Actinobacteria bacterium]|nr:ABC transporter ATP-binding protein [Actinomycetota bacterium]MBI3685857.1 ABC transporter ATP-binding protein [Actinomycetota bacterium]